MTDFCANHPDRPAAAPCHHCGKLYCRDCLTEGAEFCYCLDPACMAIAHREQESKLVTCPVCSAVLELTLEERTRQRFLCQNCDRVIGVVEKEGQPVWEMLDALEPIRYFDVSANKLIVMTFVTGGYYLFYWFYRHWKEVQTHGADIKPFWRAVFAPFFCRELFSILEAKGRGRQIEVGWSAARVTLLWWIAIIVHWIYANRDVFETGEISINLPAWPIGLFGLPGRFFLGFFLFLFVPIQNTVNELHDKFAPDLPRNTRFSNWNIAAIIYGVTIDVFWIFYGYIYPAFMKP
ncbi:hypothetical protein EHM69_11045 [candidate division KSB1 bacterium]|nr:MAG: hypothetical protein EHM69_11045 [candidate division KSB1 bacterium]